MHIGPARRDQRSLSAPGQAPQRPLVAWASVACAACAFAAVLAGWLAGGVAVDVPWAPTLDLRLDLALDGLGALYALLATGIGTVVFAYGAAYLPLHLEHEGRPATEARRFWAVDGRSSWRRWSGSRARATWSCCSSSST